MRAKFHELVALILLSVAIFIHSSNLERMGTRFMGVPALPPTTKSSSSSSRISRFSLPPIDRARGVRGMDPGDAVSRSSSRTLTLRAVGLAAAFSWLICASCSACRECIRCAFSWASSFYGILRANSYVSNKEQTQDRDGGPNSLERNSLNRRILEWRLGKRARGCSAVRATADALDRGDSRHIDCAVV